MAKNTGESSDPKDQEKEFDFIYDKRPGKGRLIRVSDW